MNHRTITPVLLASALASCTSTGTATPPIASIGQTPQAAVSTARGLWIASGSRPTKEGLVYVADTYFNHILVYNQRGYAQLPIGEISTDITFPIALSVDTHRNLWVANANSELESTILRFPQGSTAPDMILGDPNWNVLSIWVAHDGAVFAVNSGYYGNCEIVEYPPNKTTSKVIGDKRLAYLTTAVAADAKGDIFASGFAQSGAGEVDVRPAGTKRWRNTGISLAEPGGLAFDGSGNLVVTDIGHEVIETFPPGQTKPSNTIGCSTQCVSVAFDRAGNRLWVDEVNDESGEIEERTYPSGTLTDRLLPPQGSSPQSVAVSPVLSRIWH